MSGQIEILIKMQKLDDHIAELETKKDLLPKQVEHLVQNVEKAQQFLNQIDKKIEETLLKQKTHENEIKANNELKTKYSHQLEAIKTNKEYKALNSQIAILDEKNTTHENEILSIMEEVEGQKNQKTDGEKLKKLADENLKANENILKKEIEQVDNEITKLKEDRAELAKQINLNIVKKYVQLIKNKNRKAVVYCINNACSGCGFHIRPQIVIELNDPDKLIYCENCGRILVKYTE